MPKVLVQGRIAVPHADRLRAKLADLGYGDWQIVTWHPDDNAADEFASLLDGAMAVVGGGIPLPAWPSVPAMKLFQIPWTGYEFCSPATMPLGIPVANCFEHETAIAEYVLLAMLEWQLGLRVMDRRIREKGWDGMGPGRAHVHGEVMGRTVGIVGYGHIGREVAIRARAFGMRTIGIRRREVEKPAELDWLGSMADLDRLLAESDFVVIACDLNDSTRKLINADRLGRMRGDGVLINIARGGIVDEQALFEALRDRRIGGAVIDVWYNYPKPGRPEPRPWNHPFDELDNAVLTAHESGWTQEQVDRRYHFVAENLGRVACGEQPLNVVFSGAQATAS